jgi:hypothetical protein
MRSTVRFGLDTPAPIPAILISMIYLTKSSIFSRAMMTSIIRRSWGEVRLVTV